MIRSHSLSKSANWLFLFMLHVHSSCKLSGILNLECAVLPDGSSSDVIPEDATSRTILYSKCKTHANDFHKKVFLVPPWPYINLEYFRKSASFMISSDKACKAASSNALTHSWSQPIRHKASHAALFVRILRR
ncbi:hypothetical protein Tco_1171832 [Tanacetum coccineum]